MPFSGDSLPVTPVLSRKGKGWGVSGWLIKRSGGNAWRFLSIFAVRSQIIHLRHLSCHLYWYRVETKQIQRSRIQALLSFLQTYSTCNLSTSAQQNAIRPRETVSNRFSPCFIAIQKKSLDSLDHLPSGSLHRTYVNIPLPIPRWGWVMVIPGHNKTIPKYDKTGRSVHDGKLGKIL